VSARSTAAGVLGGLLVAGAVLTALYVGADRAARLAGGGGHDLVLAHQIAHRSPNGVRMSGPKAHPLLRTDLI
jgi:hypothetical protein